MIFSIITITRNNRNGLERTANSVTRQSFQDAEWLIIDGASTDGTQADFIKYPSARIISEPDAGIYDAMNKAMAMATGDYLIFMNAGDVFANETVLAEVVPLTHNNPDLIYGDSLEGGRYKTARHPRHINLGLFTHHQAIFYRKESLGNMRYDTRYKIAADYDLTLRFLKHQNRNIAYLPIPICVFEQGGISQQQATKGREEQFISRKENKACTGLENNLIRILQIVTWALRTHVPRIYRLLKK